MKSGTQAPPLNWEGKWAVGKPLERGAIQIQLTGLKLLTVLSLAPSR